MKYYFSLTAVMTSMLLASPVHAYLGGFEAADGYEPFLNDVATYNAGQYGANAGGGSYVNIPDNTGLWVKLQGPLYPANIGGNVSYATAHQYYDRTNYGYPNLDQALVITTNVDGWAGSPQEYSYTLDNFDLGGVAPLSTGGDVIDISFWACSRVFGTGEGGGLGAGTIGNTIGFYDSSGNLGFEIGYRQPGTTTDFVATNLGSWVQSSVAVNNSAYHRFDISLDLSAQTVSIAVLESSFLTNLAINAPLINPMGNFTEMRFLSTPGVNNAKLWSLDDFGMSVRPIPEPATAVLLMCAALGGLVRRRI